MPLNILFWGILQNGMRQLNVNLRKQLDAGESAEYNLLLQVSDVTIAHRLHGTISYIQQVSIYNIVERFH